MKIIRLQAENVKRLKCVEIEPDGSLVVIAGRNAQGKTSVLDSIWLTLGGGAASKTTGRPIRDGERRAKVTLDLGEMTVTRKWTKKGTTLKVESADGTAHRSPQKLLDKLIGSLSFDPLAFAGLPSKKQKATLVKLVKLPFNPFELEEERKRLFEERTVVNRGVKELSARLKAMPRAPEGTPHEEVSTADLITELKEAQAAHDMNLDAMQELSRTATERSELVDQVDRLTALLASAKGSLSNAEEEHTAAVEEAQLTGKDLPDLEEIEQRLAKSAEINKAVRDGVERIRVSNSEKRGQFKADEITDKLEALEHKKEKGLADADMPIKGLGFDEDGVTFNGLPFAQASAAERLKVSMAMAMALNPKIRVIRITDGSLLDSENLALIGRMAKANDFQCWIEKVDESGQVGVVLEDGEVISVNRAAS